MIEIEKNMKNKRLLAESEPVETSVAARKNKVVIPKKNIDIGSL
jgi:sulfur carrier protein ThiS